MIRKAKISDVKKIQKMINHHAKNGEMLPRSLNVLYEQLQNFFVYEKNKKVVGCCELFTTWGALAEVKALAVDKKYMGKGYGKALVLQCLNEAKKLGIKRVFALTYKPKFFQKLGFKIISNKKLPHKIWSECINCPYFPNCKETAVIKKI